MIRKVKDRVWSALATLFSERKDEETDRLGAWGEKVALNYLQQQGYRIIERNFRCKTGEIDIIASEGDVLAFVEVKTRSSSLFGEPEDAVDSEKERHLHRVAYFYLRKNRLRPEDTRMRFDIVSIITESDQRTIKTIKLYKGIPG